MQIQLSLVMLLAAVQTIPLHKIRWYLLSLFTWWNLL